MFNVGDLIYFNNSGTLAYGVCIAINYTSEVLVSYTVKSLSSATPPNTSYTVLVANAFVSPFPLVTPSPTVSPSHTIGLSQTPTPSPTHTVTPSASNPKYPNLFLSTTTTGWTATHGAISVVAGDLNLEATSTTTALPTFVKTFTVNSDHYYDFAFNFNQGTCRYFTLEITANGAVTYALNGSQDQSEFFEPLTLNDSGRVHVKMLVLNATSVTATLTLYADSNYVAPAVNTSNYTLTNTFMQEVFTNVSLSATPSATITPTPTPSKTVTPYPSQTPSNTPA